MAASTAWGTPSRPRAEASSAAGDAWSLGNLAQEERITPRRLEHPLPHVPVAHALSEQPRIASGTVVMVGDREHDVIGARNNGIDAIGVSYGYGTPEELHASGAIAVVHSVEELATELTELRVEG